MALNEQSQGLPFWRFIDPTEMDKAAWAMQEWIEQDLGWGILNPRVWDEVGVGASKIYDFLTRYMFLASLWHEVVTPEFESQSKFKAEMIKRWNMNVSYLNDYFQALFELRDMGRIPDTIYMPFNYVPQEIIDTLPEKFLNISEAASPILNKFLIAAVIAAIGYGAITVAAPKMLRRGG